MSTFTDIDQPIKWPGGARCAAMISFDFDAESGWLAGDPANAGRLGILSQARFGANIGVPKLVALLNDLQIKSTFFVPGWTAENHTDKVELIVRNGHEVGHHGYLHELIEGSDPNTRAREIEYLEKGLDALKRTVGVVPKGYRAPYWEISVETVPLLAKYGFAYDSSLMDTVNPYRHKLPDGSDGPVELPVHWSLDDAPYIFFTRTVPWRNATAEQVTTVWMAEFHEAYRSGGLFSLTMHPEFIGRPSRVTMLREFLLRLQTFPGVWFATGTEIAEGWASAGA